MQLINKSVGAFDETDEDMLGKAKPVPAHGLTPPQPVRVKKFVLEC